jgi:hypothetical protein
VNCRFIRGVDLSPALVQLCRDKVAQAKLPVNRVTVTEGDITDFDLGQKGEVPFEGGKLSSYDRRGPEIRVIKGRPCPAA